MNNTIIELLKTLPEPYNKQAIENYDTEFHVEGIPIDNNNDALGWAFDWKESPQGDEYWRQLRLHLEFGKPLPQQLD